MKIAIIGTDFLPMQGGIATWAFDVATALSRHGHDVTVLSRMAPDPKCPFRMIKCHGRSWNTHRAKWIGLACLRLPNIDLAIFATWDSALWAAPYLHKKGVRVFCAVHGSEVTRPDLPKEKLLQLAAHIDHWIPVSQFLASCLIEWLPTLPYTILPYPLDHQPKPNPPHVNGPLLCAARLVESKNIPFAIQLAHALKRELWVCGSGPLEAEFRQMYGASVQFYGHMERQELQKLYATAAGVVLCSQTDLNGFGAEGFGLCLLEATAHGIPTIGTNVGGIPEAIGQGILIDAEAPNLQSIQNYLAHPQSGTDNWLWHQAHHGQAAFCQALEQICLP